MMVRETITIPSEPESEHGMDIEPPSDKDLIVNEPEVEPMIDAEPSEEDEDVEETARHRKIQRVWPDVDTEKAHRYRREVDEIRTRYEDRVDMYDTTMVSEYAEEIFEYMEELEVCASLLVRISDCTETASRRM